MDLDLANRGFIVTGGTDGLGLATAQALLAEGADVLVTGRTKEKFHRAREALGADGRRVGFVAGDSADATLPGRLRTAASERWGRLDGLLVSSGGPPGGRVLDTGDDAWRDGFERIFLGTVRLVRELSAAMNNGGAIVIVLAASAKEAAREIPISNGLRPGLAMLAKSFATELGPRRIRVNTLLPNLFSTGRVRELLGERAPDTGGIALGRAGKPEEFGRMAAMLLSPVASFVTGAAISIDGGQLRSL